MKKLLVFVLAIVCCLSLVACGSSSDADKVADYVEDNREELEEQLTSEIAAIGMGIEADFYADGTKIVVDLKFDDLVDVTDEVKAQMQTTFDSMQAQFDAILDEMQKDMPEVSGLVYNVLEKDGDFVAKVEA